MPLVANVSEHVSYETRTSAKQCSQVLSDKQHGGKPVSGRVCDKRPVTRRKRPPSGFV